MRDLTKLLADISQIKMTSFTAVELRDNSKGQTVVKKMSPQIKKILREFRKYYDEVLQIALAEKRAEIQAKKDKKGDKTTFTQEEQQEANDIGVSELAEIFEKDLKSLPAVFYQKEMVVKLDQVLSLAEKLNRPEGSVIASIDSYMSNACWPRMIPKDQWDQIKILKDDLITNPKKDRQFIRDIADVNVLIKASKKYAQHIQDEMAAEQAIINKKVNTNVFTPLDDLDQLARDNILNAQVKKDPSLAAARKRYDEAQDKAQAMSELQAILHPKKANVSLGKIIEDYRNCLQQNGNIRKLSVRRDSKQTTAWKVIVSILSLGIAAPFLFKPKGAEYVDVAENVIERNKPKK